MKNISVKQLVLSAMFAALMCAVAPISIPLPGGVPVTLQTAVVLLAGLVLGPKLGFLSMLVFILLGAFGVPVFAGVTGGLGILVGPTGGFLVGYPFMALVAGLIYHLFRKATKGVYKYILIAIAMLAASAVLYIIGLGYFMFVTERGLVSALTLCFLPFIPGDILKMIVAGLVCPQLERALKSVYVPNSAAE